MTHVLSPAERRKLEEASALHSLQIPYASSINPVSTNSITDNLQISSAHTPQIPLRPQLMAPENASSIPTEIALQKLIGRLLNQNGDHLLNQEELIKQVKDWMKTTEEELQKVNKSYRNHQSAGWVISAAEKFVESFGLVFAGIIAGVATGGIGLAAAAIVVGSLLSVEVAFNDVLKKQVAEWMKKATGESEEVWVYRLQVFCSTLSMAIGVGVAGPDALRIAQQASHAALEAVRVGVNWQSDDQLKEKLSIDHALELAHSLLERTTQGISNNGEKLTKLLQLAKKIESDRLHVNQAIFA